jgi:hypothetical protein
MGERRCSRYQYESYLGMVLWAHSYSCFLLDMGSACAIWRRIKTAYWYSLARRVTKAGPYAVFWWNGSSNDVRRLADITKRTGANEDRKPEAILVIDQRPSGLRALVMSDGSKEGGNAPDNRHSRNSNEIGLRTKHA